MNNIPTNLRKEVLYKVLKELYPNAQDGVKVITEIQLETLSLCNKEARFEMETYLLEVISALKDRWKEIDLQRIIHSCITCNKECDCCNLFCDKKDCESCKCMGCFNCQKIKIALDKQI